MRSAPNSLAWARAKAKAFSLAGISEAKRMVEGLLQPGRRAAAMGTALRCGANANYGLAAHAVRRGTGDSDLKHQIWCGDPFAESPAILDAVVKDAAPCEP